MDLFAVVIRTVFFYVFVIIILRIMGKREIGELSISDFVISLLITELVAIGIDRYDQTMWLTVVPILILLFFEVSSAFLSLKFNKFRNLIEGKPSLIINRGIINYKEMIKQRYTLDDLLLALRNKGIKDLRDVEYAVLENNGNLNIFKYDFLGLSTVNPFPLILDGVIQKDTLDYINKDESWLNEYLVSNNLLKEDIFYAFYKNKNIYIIKRNELKS